MRINKNMFSINLYNSYSKSLTNSTKAMANISSGKKINSAKDNPNKVSSNETLKIAMLSSKRAEQNIQDTNSMIQTFDGAMQEMNDSLCRMRELTVKAGNGALSEDDRNAIQDEIDQLTAGINDLVNNTEFNGVSITDKSVSGTDAIYKKSLIGTMDSDSIDLPFFNLTPQNLGIDKLDMTDSNGSLESINNAIDMVSKVRGSYGAIQTGLEEISEAVSEKTINLTNVQSSIGDADIAKEYIKYSTSQILVQSSISLIAQANDIPSNALEILKNVRR